MGNSDALLTITEGASKERVRVKQGEREREREGLGKRARERARESERAIERHVYTHIHPAYLYSRGIKRERQTIIFTLIRCKISLTPNFQVGAVVAQSISGRWESNTLPLEGIKALQRLLNQCPHEMRRLAHAWLPTTCDRMLALPSDSNPTSKTAEMVRDAAQALVGAATESFARGGGITQHDSVKIGRASWRERV